MDARADSSVVKLSEVGGTVVSWRVAGREILFPRRAIAAKSGGTKQRGGLPSCFPNFGSVDPKFGLPQHGILRDLTGVREGNGSYQRVRFDRVGPLGGCGSYAKVVIEAQTFNRGFTYALRVKLPADVSKDVFVNAGFHPYFATPRQSATVISLDRHEIKGLMPEAKTLPLRKTAYVNLPDLGTVMVAPELGFDLQQARLVIWRDSLDYACVEQVMGVPSLFGTDRCKRLLVKEPEEFVLSCSYKLL